ncbi:MAG: hypothetical protein HQ559_00510 [Lentisphaerae bacterium]|nr:hypothetical protein [Lentisphaerota bacterium]
MHMTKGGAQPGVGASLDVEGLTLTAWVFAPPGAAGEPSRRNGVQLFVKDSRWRSEYGAWHNISADREGRWFRVSMVPANTPPLDGHTDTVFDPTDVVAIGLKIGAGDGSSATYTGPVYLDAVDW